MARGNEIDEYKLAELAQQLRAAAMVNKFMTFPICEIVLIADLLELSSKVIFASKRNNQELIRAINDMDEEILDWETRASEEGARAMAEIHHQMGWQK